MKNYKQNKLKFFVFLVFSLLIISPPVFASTTDGTIDPDSHFAWGENVGWVDFIQVGVTDDSLSGSAYGENIGWINMEGVTNNKEGILSGFAWGENVGYIDFSKVTIDNHGYFIGSAYGENIGWITFNKDLTNAVVTDWRPKSSREDNNTNNTSHSSSKVIGSLPISSVIQPPITSTTLVLTPTPSITTGTLLNITRTLKLNMTGDDVKALQIWLNNHGYPIALTGAGSLNNETTKFGPLTKKAVILFQKANNLTPDGIVGPITRSKLK